MKRKSQGYWWLAACLGVVTAACGGAGSSLEENGAANGEATDGRPDESGPEAGEGSAAAMTGSKAGPTGDLAMTNLLAGAELRCEPPARRGDLNALAGLMGPTELRILRERYRATNPDKTTDLPTDLSSPFARAVTHMFTKGWPSKAGGVPQRAISVSYASEVAAKALRDGKPPTKKIAMPWGGQPNWHNELVEADSREAYRAALAYAMTGKAPYAKVVKTIVEAWIANIPGAERIANNNAPLELGWAFGNMLKALLVVENAGGQGLVTAADKQRIVAWMDAVSHEFFYQDSLLPADRTSHVCTPKFYVSLKKQTDDRAAYGCPPGGTYFGNWQTTIIETRMLLAFYRGGERGKAEYAEALEYAKVLLDKFTLIDGTKAMTAETCRDVYHAGFGIAGLVELAELAWQQGNPDLYLYDDARLAKVVEFHSKINRGVLTNADVGCETGLLAPGSVQPFHELALNHYKGRMGLELPATERVVYAGAADGPGDGVDDGYGFDGYSLQWGYGAVTHRETGCR